MRNLVLGFMFIFLSLSVKAQSITWHSWSDAQELQSIQKKKVFLMLETTWCKVCKKMDNITFSNPEVISFINENFYPVKFNGESRDNIIFQGRELKFNKKDELGYHEFAYVITHGKLMYPTFVFIDENEEVIQAIPGFKSSDKLLKIANYFANDFHKQMPWKDYTSKYGAAIVTAKSSNK